MILSHWNFYVFIDFGKDGIFFLLRINKVFELLRPHLDSYEKLLNWFFLQMDFMLMDIICQRNVFFP